MHCAVPNTAKRNPGNLRTQKHQQHPLNPKRSTQMKYAPTVVKRGMESVPHSVLASVCPAYGSKCKGCNKDNHYNSMCKSSNKPIIQDESVTVFDHLCSSSHNMIAASDHNQSSANHPTLRLSHHLYDEIQQS